MSADWTWHEGTLSAKDEAKVKRLDGDNAMPHKIVVNDLYEVWIREIESSNTEILPTLVWLSIKRIDKGIIRDWRHLQRIKNELVGHECEGVELFPAESRLVDTSNQFHLWVMKDPKFRYPFGFKEKLVISKSTCGATQRPFEEG